MPKISRRNYHHSSNIIIELVHTAHFLISSSLSAILMLTAIEVARKPKNPHAFGSIALFHISIKPVPDCLLSGFRKKHDF